MRAKAKKPTAVRKVPIKATIGQYADFPPRTTKVPYILPESEAPQADAMLAQIREFFIHADGEQSIKLWNVLSALRGPDNGDSHLKVATTGVIRWVVLGSHETYVSDVITYGRDNSELVERRVKLEAEATGGNSTDPSLFHFYDHAQNAFRALGMSWEAVNS